MAGNVQGSLVIRIGAKVESFDKALKDMQKKTEALEKSLAKTAKISGVAFAGFGAAIAATVNEAAKVEKISTSFSVLTGSTERATKAIKELQTFSAKTPFQFEQIAKAGQQLLGFGFEAEALPGILQRIGDAASAVGADLNEVTLIYGQVAAAGKLTGERLLQLQERAIPIGAALAETMGVAETAVKDLVSAGKVDFATFEKAFKSLSDEGGVAFEGMQRQSETLAGKISTLQDNFALLAAAIGEHFLPAIKAAVDASIEFLGFVRENPQFVKTAATILGVGAAVSGLTLALSTGAIAFLKFRAAILAAGGAVQVLKLGIRGLVGATGIGLIIVAVSLLVEHWNAIWPLMVGVFKTFVMNIKGLATGLGNLLLGAFTFDKDRISEGLNQLKEAFKNTAEGVAQSFKDADFSNTVQEQVDMASSITEEGLRKQNEIAVDAQAERKRIAEEARAEELEAERMALEERLMMDEEFKNMTKEQQALFLEESLMTLEEHNVTRMEMERQILEERISAELEAQKRMLENEKKFGKEYAKIRAFFDQEKVKGAASASSELVRLQESESKELRAIGKVAAIADITMRTATSAMRIYEGFATIPIIGQALGIAGAVAAIAFGAEQISRVQGAAEGAVVTGGVPGMDSVPFMLTPGELVTPTRNFDEVVNSVADSRLQEAGEGIGGSGGVIDVVLSLKDDAGEMFDAVVTRRRAEGVSSI